MILKRIGVRSAAKVAAAWYAGLGLVAGFFMAAFALMGGLAAASQNEGSGAVGALFGVGAIVLFPLLYGVIGLVFGALGAWIYNLISGAIGGLEIELEQGSPSS